MAHSVVTQDFSDAGLRIAVSEIECTKDELDAAIAEVLSDIRERFAIASIEGSFVCEVMFELRGPRPPSAPPPSGSTLEVRDEDGHKVYTVGVNETIRAREKM